MTYSDFFSTKKTTMAAALLLIGPAAWADQVFNDDLIVIGRGACIGLGCADGEVFGATGELRLKANNTRIFADDNSTNPQFPANDWEIDFNGGSTDQDWFAINDVTAGTTLFKLEAGGPENALYVNDMGDVGLGTGLPDQDLHISKADTPTIRFEQDGSVFSQQVWDLAGNETNFFLRNQTAAVAAGGNEVLPLRVFSGAQHDALVLASNGVGMGISDPTAPLHVRRFAASNADMLRLESNGAAIMRLIDSNSGTSFTFQNQGSTFRVASPLVPGPELLLTETGDLTITGELVTAGSCSVGCDRVFDADYDLKPMAEHHAAMWANKHLPNVGPTPEEGPMNISEKVGGMLNELEHAHIYINQLHKRDQARAEKQAELEAVVAKQSALLAAYEARLQALEADQ